MMHVMVIHFKDTSSFNAALFLITWRISWCSSLMMTKNRTNFKDKTHDNMKFSIQAKLFATFLINYYWGEHNRYVNILKLILVSTITYPALWLGSFPTGIYFNVSLVKDPPHGDIQTWIFFPFVFIFFIFINPLNTSFMVIKKLICQAPTYLDDLHKVVSPHEMSPHEIENVQRIL